MDSTAYNTNKLLGGTFFDLSTAGSSLAYDGAVKTGALTPGLYLVSATTACHIKTGPQASVAATVGGCARLPEGAVFGVVIDVTNDTIGAIKETDAGTLYYTKVG